MPAAPPSHQALLLAIGGVAFVGQRDPGAERRPEEEPDEGLRDEERVRR